MVQRRNFNSTVFDYLHQMCTGKSARLNGKETKMVVVTPCFIVCSWYRLVKVVVKCIIIISNLSND